MDSIVPILSYHFSLSAFHSDWNSSLGYSIFWGYSIFSYRKRQIPKYLISIFWFNEYLSVALPSMMWICSSDCFLSQKLAESKRGLKVVMKLVVRGVWKGMFREREGLLERTSTPEWISFHSMGQWVSRGQEKGMKTSVLHFAQKKKMASLYWELL